MNATHTFRLPTWLSLVTLVTVLAAGCVAPGEFDAVTQDCDGQRFDVPTRDRYCSGHWDKRRVAMEAFSGNAAGPALVKSNGKWLTTLEPEGNGQLRVRFHEEQPGGDIISDRLWDQEVTLGSTVSGQVTSVAVLGLYDAIPTPTDATLAVVHETQTLSFLDLGTGPTGFGVERQQVIAEPLKALASDPQELGQGCVARDGEATFEFADVTALVEDQSPCERYLMVAARCGLVVYGKGMNVGDEPVVLAEVPIEALKLKVDPANDRLLVSSGVAGLKVRYMERLRQNLAERYRETWGSNACPVAETTDRGTAGGGDQESNNFGGNNGSTNNGVVPVGDPTNPEVNESGQVLLIECGPEAAPQPRACQDFICDRRAYADVDCMNGVCEMVNGELVMGDPDCEDAYCVEGFVSSGTRTIRDPDCVNLDGASDDITGTALVDCGGDPRCFDGVCGDNPLDLDCLDGVCPEGGNDPDCRDEECVEGVVWDAENSARRVDPDCVPQPLFDTEPGAQAVDPSDASHINVTQADYAEDRLFYVNGAIGAEEGERSTLLVG